MRPMFKYVYVTFQIKPAKVLNLPTKRYAVQCKDMDEALEVASDINSFDGVTYIRINKSGRLCKGVNILKVGEYGQI